MNTATGMLCPTCRVGLVMSERQGVEIDYCPQCRGVWLDRGELDKIIERSGAPTLTTPAAQQHAEPRREEYRRDDRDYDDKYYKKKKRESFLSDLFDF